MQLVYWFLTLWDTNMKRIFFQFSIKSNDGSLSHLCVNYMLSTSYCSRHFWLLSLSPSPLFNSKLIPNSELSLSSYEDRCCCHVDYMKKRRCSSLMTPHLPLDGTDSCYVFSLCDKCPRFLTRTPYEYLKWALQRQLTAEFPEIRFGSGSVYPIFSQSCSQPTAWQSVLWGASGKRSWAWLTTH